MIAPASCWPRPPQRYASEFGVLPGEKIVLFSNNDGAYAAATALREAGSAIAAIVDVRAEVSAEARAMLPPRRRAELLAGHAVVGDRGRQGAVRRQGPAVRPCYRHGERATAHIAADCLIVSGGWSPAIHLASQAGATPKWDDDLQAFLPPQPTQNWVGAGAFNGRFSTAEALAERTFGRTARCGRQAGPGRSCRKSARLAPISQPAPVFEIPAKGKAFVDFQHDVTAEDVRLAHREGFVSVEHLKRYTTLGMATDQGKTSNVPGLAIMAEATRQGDPRGRHDALPPALRAGLDRRAGG